MIPRGIVSLTRSLLRRSQVEREMTEEMRFHIEERTDHLVRDGMTRREASRQARLEFGAVESYKEECRAARGARWIDELWRNLRYAGRALRRRPGFAVIAILSLGLGIGGNVAVFGLMDRLLLTPLPVRDPEGLHLIRQSRGRSDRLSYPKFERLRDNFDLFESLFGWTWGDYKLEAEGRIRILDVDLVTGNYFDALGVFPAHGRLLRPEDDRIGAANAIVLSHQLWASFFGSDERVVGTTVLFHDMPFQVVGVAPPTFFGVEPSAPPDAYIPYFALEYFRPGRYKIEGMMTFFTMGRLKPEVPLAAAQQVLKEGWPRVDAELQ